MKKKRAAIKPTAGTEPSTVLRLAYVCSSLDLLSDHMFDSGDVEQSNAVSLAVLELDRIRFELEGRDDDERREQREEVTQ